MIPIKVDPWLRDVVCDPVSKTSVRIEDDRIVSDYGRSYPIAHGVFDLRALSCNVGITGELWRKGQSAYEEWSTRAALTSGEDYARQRLGVEEVYHSIPVCGRCLDVGGNDGRLRAFLSPRQEYVSIDPYIEIVNEPRSPECKRIYPFLNEPLNFIAALAEHLPFLNESFDTVHMRSVIDHFLNPELALREAFRVLRTNGRLIVGVFVVGGKTGRVSASSRLRGVAHRVLAHLGFSRFGDDHVWHPTYSNLCRLITLAGFRVQETHWQKSEYERVCYVLAI